MPAAQVEFDYCYKSLDWIIYFWYRKEILRVCHEAKMHHQLRLYKSSFSTGALRDSLQHRSRFKYEGWENDFAKVGARFELRDDVGEDYDRVPLRSACVPEFWCQMRRLRPTDHCLPLLQPLSSKSTDIQCSHRCRGIPTGLVAACNIRPRLIGRMSC